MKIEELPSQWVWLEPGTPILFHADRRAPDLVAEHLVVRIDRIGPAEADRPALAIWSDDRGEHGVEARRVTNQVMSLPPSGDSPVAKVAEAIEARIRGHRR